MGFCNGQILSIAQNTALFSLLGTTFGGNGQTTFALPDLRGRVPVHPGQGPGLSNYVIGQSAGSETTTLLLSNVPQHNHPLNATSEAGTTSAPAGAYLGNTGALDREYNTSGTVVAMNAGAIGVAGDHSHLITYSLIWPLITSLLYREFFQAVINWNNPVIFHIERYFQSPGLVETVGATVAGGI